jgi:hypothetical protein
MIPNLPINNIVSPITIKTFLALQIKEHDHNYFNSPINGRRQTFIFRPELLELDMTIDKNINFSLIHIPNGKF